MVLFIPRHLNVSQFNHLVSYCWLSMLLFCFLLPLSPSFSLSYHKWSMMNILVPTYLWTCLISSLGNILETELLVQRKSTFDTYIFKVFSMLSFHLNPALKTRHCFSSPDVMLHSPRRLFLTPHSGWSAFLLPAQPLVLPHPGNYPKVLGLPWTIQEHWISWGQCLSLFSPQKCTLGASLVAQWLRVCLPMQGTRVRAPGLGRSHMPQSN